MSKESIDNFTNELKKAVSLHYKTLKEKFPDENYYGYSLYSSEDVPDIFPVANKLSALEIDEANPEYLYYKYCPNEWSDWESFGIFDEVNKLMKGLKEEISVTTYKPIILLRSLKILKELDSEGLFGDKNDNRFLVFFLSDSKNDMIKQSAKELNTSKVYKEFVSIF